MQNNESNRPVCLERSKIRFVLFNVLFCRLIFFFFFFEKYMRNIFLNEKNLMIVELLNVYAIREKKEVKKKINATIEKNKVIFISHKKEEK